MEENQPNSDAPNLPILTPVDELKRLELRFMMANDEKISSVLEIIFVDILRKFFEHDVLEVFSLESNEKIRTLVSICNHIRDRIQTSQNKIKIPIKQILEFMIIEEFDENIHLNKIIQLFLQETVYDLLKNALLQDAGNKSSCVGLLFQASLKKNITQQFQHRIFFMFIHCIPKISRDLKENLSIVGFPQILIEEGIIDKFKEFAVYLLYYFNFLDEKKTGLKAKINQFKEEIIRGDSDTAIVKFGGKKMNLNETLKYLQLNLLEFISIAFTMQPEQDSEKNIEENKGENEEIEEKKYPSYSFKIIPILMISTASVINEVNEKAMIIIKGFEKHSDIDQPSMNIRSSQNENDTENDQFPSNSGLNAVIVWADIMKYFLDMTRNTLPQSLGKFDDQVKKTVVLFSRNLKRNILEYALK